MATIVSTGTALPMIRCSQPRRSRRLLSTWRNPESRSSTAIRSGGPDGACPAAAGAARGGAAGGRGGGGGEGGGGGVGGEHPPPGGVRRTPRSVHHSLFTR